MLSLKANVEGRPPKVRFNWCREWSGQPDGWTDGWMGKWTVACGLWHGRRRERMKMGMGMGMVCQREGLAESAVLLPRWWVCRLQRWRIWPSLGWSAGWGAGMARIFICGKQADQWNQAKQAKTSDDRLKNQTFELALSLSLSLGVKFQINLSVCVLNLFSLVF